MQFKFEELIIWQKAMDYGERIFRLSYKLPKEEMYNLSSQIRIAVDSIGLNISEGSIGQSKSQMSGIFQKSIQHGTFNFGLRTSGFGLISYIDLNGRMDFGSTQFVNILLFFLNSGPRFPGFVGFRQFFSQLRTRLLSGSDFGLQIIRH